MTATRAPGRRAPTGVPVERRSWVEHLMGMPVSIHVRGAGARGDDVAVTVTSVYAAMRAAEDVFSTWHPDSQVSRLQRGELTLADAGPDVVEVHRLCQVARIRTRGWFDAWNAVPDRPGVFDPTGLVKTWAVARAARPLRALARARGFGFAIGAGGDVLTVPGADGRPWEVGVEDPHDRTRVLATITSHDGGVATSGIVARGAHILDPHTGERVTGVLSVTVAGPSLMWADVFATAAVAMGPAGARWAAELPDTSGIAVLADGTIHRWGAAD